MAKRGRKATKEPEAVQEPEAAEYGPDEHEMMLQHLDLMHHETRQQTIARLKAALKAS